MTTARNPVDRPAAAPVPHLREVLGAAALASGLVLADGPEGVNPEVAAWFSLAKAWLKHRGLTD